jgi:hypothetical protein
LSRMPWERDPHHREHASAGRVARMRVPSPDNRSRMSWECRGLGSEWTCRHTALAVPVLTSQRAHTSSASAAAHTLERIWMSTTRGGTGCATGRVLCEIRASSLLHVLKWLQNNYVYSCGRCNLGGQQENKCHIRNVIPTLESREPANLSCYS